MKRLQNPSQKRYLFSWLILFLFILLVSGCKNPDTKENYTIPAFQGNEVSAPYQNQTGTIPNNDLPLNNSFHTWDTSFYSLPDMDFLQILHIEEEEVYCICTQNSADPENAAPWLCTVALSGQDIRPLLEISPNQTIGGMSVESDGSFTILRTDVRPDCGKICERVSADVDGTIIERQDITAALFEEETMPVSVILEDMCATSNGNIVIQIYDIDENTRTVVAIDGQGKRQSVIHMDADEARLLVGQSGQVFCLMTEPFYTGVAWSLYEMDLANDTRKACMEKLFTGSNIQWAVTNDDAFLITCGNTLYRVDAQAGICETILTWSDYNIVAEELAGLFALADGRFLAVTYTQKTHPVFISKAEAVYLQQSAQIDSRQTITLGILNLRTQDAQGNLRALVADFNRENSSYQIQIKEYAPDGDYTNGRIQLNADYAAGQGPDILELSDIPVDSYIAKGVLVDLHSLVREEYGEQSLLTSHALSYYKRDEALYGIFPGFFIRTTIGKTSALGTNFGGSVSDLQALFDSLPEETTLFPPYYNPEIVLEWLLTLELDSYIDWESGCCHFDSPEFAEVLSFAAAYPQGMVVPGEDLYAGLAENRHLLQSLDINSTGFFLGIWAFLGGDVSYMGYPAGTENAPLLQPTGPRLGISAKSSHLQGAWEFVVRLLDEEYQESWLIGFPAGQSQLEQVLQRATENDPTRSESRYFSTFEYVTQAATQAELLVLRRLIEEARPPVRWETELKRIIGEEAGALFAGQKEAEEVARIIQNRVQLFLDERS